MQDNIIVKPSVEKQFDRFLRQGRVLFFSAPCGFGKTAVAEALLSSREVLRLPADSAGFKLPSAEADWQILLLDDLQDMQGGAGLECPVRTDPCLPRAPLRPALPRHAAGEPHGLSIHGADDGAGGRRPAL